MSNVFSINYTMIHDMRELFVIFFFSKTVLLTPYPIDLYGSIELTLDNPIEAITTGAGIEIDVSTMIKWESREDIEGFERRLLSLFPPGSVSAKIIGNNIKLPMYYEGAYSFNENSVVLYLDAKHGVPTGIKFSMVIVSSTVEMKNIKIFWRNYKH